MVSQASSLRQFNPVYTGIQQTGGLTLPEGTLSLAGEGFRGALTSRWFKLTGHAPRFVSELRELKPTVIHAHFEEAGLAGLALSRALDIPLVTTFHGYDATAADPHTGAKRLLGRIYQRQRDELQAEGEIFLAVSQFIKEKIIARGYPRERTVVLPIGVDVDAFTPGADEERTPTVLFVGRLVEKKGVSYLLQAMARVSAERPDARLVIIGDGPLRANLEEEACELRLPHVLFAGTLDHAIVRQHMARASVFAIPSITAASGDSEGLPIVACEAQAMGLPIVATQHAGLPEIVTHGENGFLVPERSVDQMATHIISLLRNDNLRRFLGAAARMNVCHHFSLQRQTELLEEVYRKAILRRQIIRELA